MVVRAQTPEEVSFFFFCRGGITGIYRLPWLLYGYWHLNSRLITGQQMLLTAELSLAML